MKAQPAGSYKDWLKTRPKSVQKLAAEFPLGSECEGRNGEILFIIGYTEDDAIVLTPINPSDDYESACAQRVHVCASHYRSTETDE